MEIHTYFFIHSEITDTILSVPHRVAISTTLGSASTNAYLRGEKVTRKQGSIVENILFCPSFDMLGIFPQIWKRFLKWHSCMMNWLSAISVISFNSNKILFRKFGENQFKILDFGSNMICKIRIVHWNFAKTIRNLQISETTKSFGRSSNKYENDIKSPLCR